MRKLLAPAAVAVICLAVLLAALPSLAFPDGGGAGVSGTFPANLNVQSDVCLHDLVIWGGPPPHNRLLQVVVEPGAPGAPDRITISGPSPFVQVQAFMEGTNFSATGMGPVGPDPNASVAMTGTWNGSTLTGTYAMGSGPNDLPQCDPPGGQPLGHYPALYTINLKPGATPTATPPQKLYSIIVIKQHADTFQPLSGWKINLYRVAGCQGLPLSSLTTGADGMVDFAPLAPGTYSVQEKNQPGWNPDGPVCQDVAVGAAGSPAGQPPPCPIQPDADHPQPGCDSFSSGARVVVRINATGELSTVNLNGPTLIRRNNKPIDKDQDGLDEINTEVVFMELAGGGITVRESPTRASIGVIEEQANASPGVLNFPATSYFDVFFEVDLAGGVTLHNETPFRIQCKITEIPPFLCFYVPPIREPIVLLNAQGVKIATLLHGKHIPLPPNEALIIFTNRPKATPTRTPTSAGTPTRTPTSAGTPTRTPTSAGTPTRTPTPQGTATPTNPLPNGGCEKVEQEAPFQGAMWELWKCQPANPGVPFDRVDLSVGSATQDFKLDPQFPPRFVCQTTQEKVIGQFKVRKKNVNPGAALPHNEVWSAEFAAKCQEGVQVYLRPRLPTNHPVITGVAFTNVGPVEPTATPAATRTPTPTPAKPLGDVNDDGFVDSRDALLILQRNAGLLAALPNPASADLDDDDDIDSIDALIVLQVDAGLLDLLAGRATEAGDPPLLSLLW